MEQGGNDAFIKWKNIEIDDSLIIEEAKSKIKLFDYRITEVNEQKVQVFLLQNKEEVNFRKISNGGLYGSKKYFRDIARKYKATNSKELAKKLKNITWE